MSRVLELVSKRGYVHTMEYYFSDLKKKKKKEFSSHKKT